METQWPRQKALLPSPRGHLWSWTAITRPFTQLLSFFGTSSIATKLPRSSWRAQQSTRRASSRGFKPHILRATAPSTWRNPLSNCQTQLCTTALWETQWGRLQGKLSTNPEGHQRGSLGRECHILPLHSMSLFIVSSGKWTKLWWFLETYEVGNCSAGRIGEMSLKGNPSVDTQKCSARKAPLFSRFQTFPGKHFQKKSIMELVYHNTLTIWLLKSPSNIVHFMQTNEGLRLWSLVFCISPYN